MCGAKTAVLETRKELSALVMRRRRGCGQCGNKFFTHEIDDGLVETLKKYLVPHVKAIKKRQKLYARNEQILNMMRAGEKHFVIARTFKLSENMISTIARNAGIPAYQKTTREKNIK
jgi:transcriptional regulator NrdR family protein